MTATLPQQVQRQLEEAERIQASLADPATSPQETPPEPPASPPVAPVPPVSEPPQPAVPERDAAVEWKARFDALQGKYNSEIPRMHEEARARDAQIHAMQQQLNEVLAARRQTPAQPEPLVTSQDEEKFGSDLVDVMRRVSKEQAAAFLQRLGSVEQALSTIAPQVRQVERVGQEVVDQKTERYWTALDQGMPDWQSVNADPEWISWLAQYDVVAGRTRQEVLNDASTALDHRRVIAIFQLFKDAKAGGGEAPAAAPTPQPRQTAQSELARQVAPAKSSTTTTVPTGVKTFSGKEYSYWVDPRRVHDTAPAKLDQALNEMESALAEGRIKW